MDIDRATRLLLVFYAIGFLPVALLGWFAPDLLFSTIGVQITDAAGYAEVRAAYGGHFFAASALFAVGAGRAEVRETSLRMGTLILAGFVFGRLLSLGLEGVPNVYAWATLALESTGLVLGLILIRLRAG